jgi:hypothetical protein
MPDELLDMELKTFGAWEIKDADQGEVVAIVATLNVVDKDGDVILPGAIPANSAVKLSAYGHDVVTEGASPVGKGTISEEGNTAVFRGRFFLSTQRGREAFNTVKEMGPESQWSFGYPRKVQTGELTAEWRGKGARRIITGMQPIEASPVFIGAGRGTGTVLAKAAEDAAAALAAEATAKQEAEAEAQAAATNRLRAEETGRTMGRIADVLKRR